MDITKCKGIQRMLKHDEICPKRESCGRYTAQPEPHQSVFVGTPYDPKTNDCTEYLEIKDQDYYGTSYR